MKSLNNLLLLGDGETWSRQKVDFAGLPEMVRTFLQVAAGAADIPVTRLLGQSPAGMSATGESDTRNYYDMISSRQEIDLRHKLERLDDLVPRSAGLDPAALSFEFRPLWQMDASASATIALQKAQATQIYAGLNLWPASVTAKLVEAQLAEDGTYPGGEGIFAEAPLPRPTADFDPAQPRDPDGRWTNGGGSAGSAAAGGTSTSQSQAKAPTAPLSNAATTKGPDQVGGIPPDLSEALGALLQALDPIGTASAHEAPTQRPGESLSRSVVTAGLPDTVVRNLAPLLVAALFALYRSSQGAIQELLKHFPSWPSGETPGGKPLASSPAKPGAGHPDDPAVEPPEGFRPLTIHRRQSHGSGPPPSEPANSLPPLPPSTASSSGATSPPGYSVSGSDPGSATPPSGHTAPSGPSTSFNQSAEEDPKEKVLQEQVRKGLETDLDNTKEHTTDKDLIAAQWESHGDFRLTKSDGTPYNHVQEVKQTQIALQRIIQRAKGLLGRPRVLPSEVRPLQDLLGEASRSLDRTEQYVPSKTFETGDGLDRLTLPLDLIDNFIR